MHQTSLRLFLEQELLVATLHSSALKGTSFLCCPYRSKTPLTKFISWLYSGQYVLTFPSSKASTNLPQENLTMYALTFFMICIPWTCVLFVNLNIK